MKKYILGLGILALTLGACQKEEEIGGTAVQEMAGEWYVRESVNNGATYADDYYHFATFNTSSNSSSEILIDDFGSFWEIRGKVPINLANLTFGGTDSINNLIYSSKFLVQNGKIIKNGAKAPGSKAATDSIYFQVKLSDDGPTDVTYTFSGYKKTGFLEDEH